MTMKDEAPSVPECYISEHEGFYGTIKNFTRDFVVTEIDIHGQMVTKPSLSDVPQSSNITEACPGAKSEGKTNIISPKHQHNLKEENSEPGPGQNGDITSTANQDCFDLSIILGQTVCEELEQFTALLREMSSCPNDGVEKKLANQESSNGSEKKMANQELSLGSFPDKHQRANVHRAVRHSFPFLLTVTNQSEIRVKEDPDFKLLSGLVSEEEAEDFIRFIDTKMPNSVYTFRSDDSKEHRTAVHHFLSRRFGKLVETKSFSDQQQKTTAITVRLREKGKPRKRTADDSKEEEVYTAFTLRKENLETLEAISYMAAVLGVLPSDFTYAGIKDKRAVTYQSMVVKKISPQRLREKASEFEKRGVVLSSVRSVSEPLHLGRLQGNHFDLVVRDLRSHQGHGTLMELDSRVQEAVENVKVKGFVNYYGPQRFGTGQSVQSDRIGLALLKEEMVAAVRLFFTPEEGDDPQSVAKRHFLQTDNAKEALFLMPMSKARERMMLRALHRYGTGPEGCTRAWLSLPHGMRVFYPHAYCRSGIHITCLIAFKYPESFMVLFVFLLSFVFPSSSSLTLFEVYYINKDCFDLQPGLERGGCTQADHAGPQGQAGRSGLEAEERGGDRGGRNQLTSDSCCYCCRGGGGSLLTRTGMYIHTHTHTCPLPCSTVPCTILTINLLCKHGCVV
uniref:Pseudouridylate synthase PUS7L n=1 Tax=Oncorhynchus mykiss TaxID=8022 RepID=A0A8K9XGS9_ONCMY